MSNFNLVYRKHFIKYMYIQVCVCVSNLDFCYYNV